MTKLILVCAGLATLLLAALALAGTTWSVPLALVAVAVGVVAAMERIA